MAFGQNFANQVNQYSNANYCGYVNKVKKQVIGLPPSIERRNARERNRVKQVNNGFDRLRQYIPRAIVEAENGGRGPSKKLSKVDTLKYVVKYIKGLQDLLDDYDHKLENSETGSIISNNSFECTSSSSHSVHDDQFNEYQTYHKNSISYSEPSTSPSPSEISSNNQGHFYSPTMPQDYHYQQSDKGFREMNFKEDSGYGVEEDGILDDIICWQMQN